MSQDPAYPPVAELVPHGPPILALDTLVTWEPGRATCRAVLRDDMPFVQDGRVATVVTLEYMAQAVAACLGHEAYAGGEGVRVGMLVAVRSMELHAPSLDVGQPITIEVERVRGNDEVSTFRGTASAAGTEVATALMTLVHADRPPDDAPA